MTDDELTQPDADRAPLDSGCIRLTIRNDFGENEPTIFNQVDLRAAIDAARRTTDPTPPGDTPQ